MIKSIQGLNLESDTSIVKISLDGDNIGDISTVLDKISSFHPLFIKEYSISPNLLTISSKLPFLWRESADTFNELSKGNITLDKAQDYIINTLLSKRIKSMSTVSPLYSCMKKRIEVTPAVLENFIPDDSKEGYDAVYNRYYTLGCGKGSHITGSVASSKDAHMAEKIQRDKWTTNTVIQRLNLPVHKWKVIKSKQEIEDIWDEFDKPVVIKPTGLTAGRGVSVGIDTLEKAKEAFEYAKEKVQGDGRPSWQKKIMIEEQIQGEDYRLLVIDGNLEVVTKRIPAFVIGDGKSNIEELIKKENENPKRDVKNPAHILKPIIIDRPLLAFLKDQGLTLTSIPQKDEKISVRKVASMSQGGITEDFTDKVGKEIRILVESIARSIHAFTLGIDIICLDISKPLTKENGSILEINTMPEAYLNLYPVIGKQREYVADRYVEYLLSENSCKRFVVVGQSKNNLPTLLRKRWVIKKEHNVGEIIDDRYYINGILINNGKEKWQSVESIKCNSLLDFILLNYRDWSEVRDNGFGFDYIDTLYITKDQSINKECMKIVKGYKRKRLINKIKIIS